MEQQAIELALGRMFRLMSRPTQEGDIEQYEACRRVILECAPDATLDYSPNYARDHNKGCA